MLAGPGTTWPTNVMFVAVVPGLKKKKPLPGGSDGGVEAARLASGEARQPGKLENTSQGSSSPSRNRSGSQAACGVAFGFIGMLVGSMIAEKFPGPDPMSTQLAGVAIGGGSGVAIGIWLGGR